MKKIILTSVAILVFGLTNAQDNTAKVYKTAFGIKGGMNIANLSGDTDTELGRLKSKIGFNVGFFADFRQSEKFSVQLELLYSTQGAQIKIDENYGGISITGYDRLNLGYINVPVMAKYYVSEKFTIEAGPQIGFLVSAQEKYSIEASNGESDSGSEDIIENFQTVDFGLNFGLGYDITSKLNANFRYNLGLTNIAETEPGDDTNVKNSVISISLGYKLN